MDPLSSSPVVTLTPIRLSPPPARDVTSAPSPVPAVDRGHHAAPKAVPLKLPWILDAFSSPETTGSSVTILQQWQVQSFSSGYDKQQILYIADLAGWGPCFLVKFLGAEPPEGIQRSMSNTRPVVIDEVPTAIPEPDYMDAIQSGKFVCGMWNRGRKQEYSFLTVFLGKSRDQPSSHIPPFGETETSTETSQALSGCQVPGANEVTDANISRPLVMPSQPPPLPERGRGAGVKRKHCDSGSGPSHEEILTEKRRMLNSGSMKPLFQFPDNQTTISTNSGHGYGSPQAITHRPPLGEREPSLKLLTSHGEYVSWLDFKSSGDNAFLHYELSLAQAMLSLESECLSSWFDSITKKVSMSSEAAGFGLIGGDRNELEVETLKRPFRAKMSSDFKFLWLISRRISPAHALLLICWPRISLKQATKNLKCMALALQWMKANTEALTCSKLVATAETLKINC